MHTGLHYSKSSQYFRYCQVPLFWFAKIYFYIAYKLHKYYICYKIRTYKLSLYIDYKVSHPATLLEKTIKILTQDRACIITNM